MKKLLLFTLFVLGIAVGGCAQKECIECSYGLAGQTTQVPRFCGTTKETAEYQATVEEAAAAIDSKANCVRSND